MNHVWTYVDTTELLAQELAAIEGATLLGVDTEADSFFHYRERVCLIQITGKQRDLIVDPLRIPHDALTEALEPWMANPDVEKIFHGSDYDISSLKRDFGFEITPIFDTMICAQALGFERFSLADLVEHYFGVKLEKKYQRRDWSKRPLRDEHLSYARLDSHYLPRIRRLLWKEVAAAGREDQLMEEFSILEKKEWVDHSFKPDDFLRIKGVGTLDERGKRVLRALGVMRDRHARRVDRPHFKVIANQLLLKIAVRPPRSLNQLRRLLGEKNHVVRRYAEDVLDAVDEGLKDRSKLPKSRPHPHSRPGRRLNTPEETRTFEALRTWRNKTAETRKVQPGVVVPNAVLQEIAAVGPRTQTELESIRELRRWQCKEYGDELLRIVGEIRS